MQPKKYPNSLILRWWRSLPGNWRAWFPSRGTILFVVVVVAVLFYASSVGAFPLRTPSAASVSVISYQGRLTDSSGNPLTGPYNLVFRIYAVPTGGSALWTETWSVNVADGLFNVMLGSINNTLASAIAGRDTLYLGIAVGSDSEMMPRVQMGSVPFSMTAQRLMEQVTTEQIANGAVTQHQAVSGSMDASTSSTAFVDLPSRSVTLTTSGGPVLVMFSGSHHPSEAGVVGYWQIVRDGSVVVALNNHAFESSMYEWTTTALFGMDTPPAGVHTYKVQWRVSQGTLIASEGVYSENFVVIEFKR